MDGSVSGGGSGVEVLGSEQYENFHDGDIEERENEGPDEGKYDKGEQGGAIGDVSREGDVVIVGSVAQEGREAAAAGGGELGLEEGTNVILRPPRYGFNDKVQWAL